MASYPVDACDTSDVALLDGTRYANVKEVGCIRHFLNAGQHFSTMRLQVPDDTWDVFSGLLLVFDNMGIDAQSGAIGNVILLHFGFMRSG